MAIKRKEDLPPELQAEIDRDESEDDADPKDLSRWRRGSAAENAKVDRLLAELRQKRKAGRPRVNPPSKPISINLPLELLAQVKAIAEERDVGYQSLIKEAVSQFVDEVRAAKRKR